MSVNDLTLGEVKEMVRLFSGAATACPFIVGKSYLFRTVTFYWLGCVKEVVGHFLILGTAGWVADTGRYNEAILNGRLSEFEPISNLDAIINIESIVDSVEWKHPLPTEVK